jgi:hypothetical protein
MDVEVCWGSESCSGKCEKIAKNAKNVWGLLRPYNEIEFREYDARKVEPSES